MLLRLGHGGSDSALGVGQIDQMVNLITVRPERRSQFAEEGEKTSLRGSPGELACFRGGEETFSRPLEHSLLRDDHGGFAALAAKQHDASSFDRQLYWHQACRESPANSRRKAGRSAQPPGEDSYSGLTTFTASTSISKLSSKRRESLRFAC